MKWSLILLFAGSLLCAGRAAVLLFQVFSGQRPRLRAGDSWRRTARPYTAKRRTTNCRSSSSSPRPRPPRSIGLVEKLDNFKHPVESGLKVAFMGTKTFRCEKGARKDRSAVQLFRGPECQSCFGTGASGMTESAQHRIDLGPRRQVRQAGRGQGAATCLGPPSSASAWSGWSSICPRWTASSRTKATCTPRARGPRRSPSSSARRAGVQ